MKRIFELLRTYSHHFQRYNVGVESCFKLGHVDGEVIGRVLEGGAAQPRHDEARQSLSAE